MKALILNSGMGKRMGDLSSEHPKCMTEISAKETILSRQLRQLLEVGITEVIITTGYFDNVLINYVNSLEMPINVTFINNPVYDKTNYIYSIYCAKDYLIDTDIFLIHGDVVMENAALDEIIACDESCMAVSSTVPLPEKDFKAVIDNGRIFKVGIEFFNQAMAAQPVYKLASKDWNIWLNAIENFCLDEKTTWYAEKAFNEVSDRCKVLPMDIKDMLCNEVDNPEDLAVVRTKLREIENRIVYMCFSTDIVHSGHISIIHKARRLGKLVVGVLSDCAVASYKTSPIVFFEERKALFSGIEGVYKTVEQSKLSYRENIEKLQPAYVVHGDDWLEGVQKPIRDEVIATLAEYGGKLIEFPFSEGDKYSLIKARASMAASVPDVRRGAIRRLLRIKPCITVIEAHSGITGLIAEKTISYSNGEPHQFDGMWVSSLCDSTAKGKPDIELVDMSSRMRTIDDIMEVTTKPIILDGDTGGMIEHFVYNIRTLERVGVSAVIIEDKTGLKKNSLFGTEVEQTQDSIENFCAKISAGKRVQKTAEFMIIARIESLILEAGMEDALDRAFAYVAAGADGIMIHSRKKSPDEVFEFVEKFRSKESDTPIVVVPTSYNTVTEEEFAQRGVNIIIYANQLTRSGFPAMQKVAKTILDNHRAKEADDMCMSIKDIITLIPEN